jgi:thiamine-monophosphate kinase
MAERPNNRPGEFALIERYFRPLASEQGAFGLVDDAALYSPAPDEELVLTVDLIAAGVHFMADDPPVSIARKALRVNLSDLAAKGAKPVGYLVSLALPEDWTEDWVRDFSKGLAEDQATFGTALLGGDTTRASGGVTVSITAIGSVPKGGMVHRSGARPGDAIFVSGTIGDAALGLGVRRGKYKPSQVAARFLRDRYLHPQPRVALAPLVRTFATSAMDVSDGLVGDLAHICEASRVGATIDATQIPLSEAAREVVESSSIAFSEAITGGDDYEILASVPEARASDFSAGAKAVGVPVTRIGRIVAGEGPPVVLGIDGNPLIFEALGHTHF